MKTQHARLCVTIPTLLLAATLLLVNIHHSSAPFPASVAAPEKIETPYGVLHMDAILTYAPSTRLHVQKALTAFQAGQRGRQMVGDFKLQNVAGGFMTSDDLKDKVTVVDIWAPWCEWCVEEIPIYNRLYGAFEGHDF